MEETKRLYVNKTFLEPSQQRRALTFFLRFMRPAFCVYISFKKKKKKKKLKLLVTPNETETKKNMHN